MALIPIRTEADIRSTPMGNYVLLAINVLAFLVLDLLGSAQTAEFKSRILTLNAAYPAVYQFFTYQFLHGDGWHLIGNMLFLWVFGNAVNAKMGDWTYVVFYLAGGVFAAVGFVVVSTAPMLGASGAIAAVTTAYLVLFPRSRVLVMYMLFFIGFIEVPAMLIIGLKIILWDNVLAPAVGGAGNVAISAHLAGYLFGFATTLTLLLIRALPRDQFDLLALMDRWNRRRAFASAMASPEARAQAKHGRVARPVEASQVQSDAQSAQMDRVTELRGQINEQLGRERVAEAASLYETLVSVDARQCLADRQQVQIAREFYATGRFAQAAAAFERYLKSYGQGREGNEIRLLLGIIHARDLKQYETAEGHLEKVYQSLSNPDHRDQCKRWLVEVRGALGKPAPDL
ncbi:MAG: rhomboid family intramembrane serine protease [Planctomycetes bacterium]|nr:rhomboid family intramembrane serine protease [Planctomycetota bacterium]